MAQDLFGICPYATAQRVIQGKWTVLILFYISRRPMRFNELLRKLPNMTHATLSRQLKQMEKDGLIVRKEFAQIPPKVEYSLTGIGQKFVPVLAAIKQWGYDYIAFLETAPPLEKEEPRP